MDKRLDSIIWGMFLLLSVISMVNAISLTMLSFTEGPYMYYIRPFNLDEEYNPNEPWTVFGLSLVSSVILYGYLIPLAMYVSLELVRMVQAYFISMDVLMGDNGKFAKAKSCGLNEELGQVRGEFVLSPLPSMFLSYFNVPLHRSPQFSQIRLEL